MTLFVGALVVVVFSLATTMAIGQKSAMADAVAILGTSLVVSLFVTIRRALRRASVLVDRILREELEAEPVAARNNE